MKTHLEKKYQNKKLKLIQIGLTYVIPRLKQVEDVSYEMPTNFQIEIIDSLSKYSIFLSTFKLTSCPKLASGMNNNRRIIFFIFVFDYNKPPNAPKIQNPINIFKLSLKVLLTVQDFFKKDNTLNIIAKKG